MRNVLSLGVLAVLLPLCSGQEPLIPHPSVLVTDPINDQQPARAANLAKDLDPLDTNTTATSSALSPRPGMSTSKDVLRFRYYLAETYLNPSVFTAPAFTASMRMAHPPGKGATRYPNEWRQGAEGFGRNYGDAFAARISTHTTQFLTGMVTREQSWYTPSASHSFFARSSHAVFFTFFDQSDSGRRVPALSNFVGAAAGGFAGNAYLPDGFRDLTHAGQRATSQFGLLAAGNLFREFAPQMPRSIQVLVSLIAR